MLGKSFFGDENSPLRESPEFRRYMEEYNLIDKKIDELQENRGYLSYEDTMLLKKLKKMRLSTKDELVKCKSTLVTN
jgi:uncharacterized protein YdcH (DUF465 family)